MNNSRLLIFQGIVAKYNIPTWRKLAQKLETKVVVIASNDLPFYGVRGTSEDSDDYLQIFTLKSTVKFKINHFIISWFDEAKKVISIINPEVILCEENLTYLSAIWLFFYAKKRKIPFFWWGLGRVFTKKQSPWRNRVRTFHRFLLLNATGVLCYSSKAKNYYIMEYGVPQEKCFVIHNAIDDVIIRKNYDFFALQRNEIRKSLGLNDGEIVFLYVGSLLKSKKANELINAGEILSKKGFKFHILIVGQGELESEIKSISHIYSWLHYLGAVYEGVEKYYCVSDVFVQPGLGGLGLYQAMVCELAIIATDGDGCEYDLVIENLNGFLPSRPLNINDLAELMERFIFDPTLAKKMGKESYNLIVTKFSDDSQVQRIVKAIKSYYL